MMNRPACAPGTRLLDCIDASTSSNPPRLNATTTAQPRERASPPRLGVDVGDPADQDERSDSRGPCFEVQLRAPLCEGVLDQ